MCQSLMLIQIVIKHLIHNLFLFISFVCSIHQLIYLQINYTLDLQRNRVETAHVLKLAMEEYDYKRSLAILKAQVEKIQASVSAQDPFCQINKRS